MKKAKVGVTALNALMEAAGSTVSTEVLMEATKASHKAQNLKAVGGKDKKSKEPKVKEPKRLSKKAMLKTLASFLRIDDNKRYTEDEFILAMSDRIASRIENRAALARLRTKQ